MLAEDVKLDAMRACLAGTYEPPLDIATEPALLAAWRDGTRTVDFYQLDRLELAHRAEAPL